jgi:adenosine deaminase
MLDLIALPKTELHLHLEGAVPATTLLQLIHKYGDRSAVPDLAALEMKLKHQNVDEFMAVYVWAVSYLREYEDFTLAARGIVNDLHAQGVWYAEISFSPGMFDRIGLELQPLAKAIRAGLADSTDVKTNLLVDLIRDRGPQQGDRRLSQTAEVAKETGIVGIGIGGSEIEFPPEPFAPVFRRAADLGLHRVAHAGEWVGPESVWGAIRALGVERIGHGTRSFEDPALVKYLCKARLPLEVCLTSNVCTGTVTNVRDHLMLKYFEAGIPITLSSDDPTLFHTTIVDEYNHARASLGISDANLIKIARTGFVIAFLDESERLRFLTNFDTEVDKLKERT